MPDLNAPALIVVRESASYMKRDGINGTRGFYEAPVPVATSRPCRLELIVSLSELIVKLKEARRVTSHIELRIPKSRLLISGHKVFLALQIYPQVLSAAVPT
jgi:hypothetical protein